MPKITIENLAKSYGRAQALDDISFTVDDGEFFTLLGPSGCGKSTTLSALAGLDEPDSGIIKSGDTVFVDSARGVCLAPEERNLGMVFQSYALWPHMTVKQNLEMPLKLRRVAVKDRNRLVGETLKQVGLEQFGDRYPHAMSGGQQQRVALARSLVYSPDLMLLDEPLSNLDAQLREQARTWLKSLQQQLGITTVYVTHDQTEALTLSDRIAVMKDGRMLQIGTPEEIYETPSEAGVADFIGRCNFVDAKCTEGAIQGEIATFRLTDGGETLRLAVVAPVETGVPVTLGLRAERCSVVGPRAGIRGNALSVAVEERLYAGSTFEYVAKLGSSRLVVEDSNRVDPGPARLVVPESGVYVFDRVPNASGAAA